MALEKVREAEDRALEKKLEIEKMRKDLLAQKAEIQRSCEITQRRQKAAIKAPCFFAAAAGS